MEASTTRPSAEGGLLLPVGSSNVQAVIQLRRRLERGIRHPVVGPLLILLLAVLLAMTVMHETHESIGGDPGEFCVALVGVLLALLTFVVQIVAFAHVLAPTLSRGPPERPLVACSVGRARPDILSLRL